MFIFNMVSKFIVPPAGLPNEGLWKAQSETLALYQDELAQTRGVISASC